ncbi:MAG: hypothetical protein ACR2J9_08555 [Gaiellales bacterium]
MSAARAASYLMDQGAYRRDVAVELARGIVEDAGSPADEIALASTILRRAGHIEEAVVAAGIAAARGADIPETAAIARRRWSRVRGPFSRAA